MRTVTLHLIVLTGFGLAACQPAPEERYARAEAFYAEHEYRAAVIELKNALQQQPGYGDARYLLARASYKLGDFATAQAESERALAQGLTHSGVWFELGRALLAQGDAEGAFERVVPDLPAETASPEELVLLGDIFFALGNTGEASDRYLRAQNLNPAEPGAFVGQAAVAVEAGDHERAVELLAAAAEHNPEDDFVWRARGNYLRSIGRDVEAAKAFSRSIELETAATPAADQLNVRVARAATLLDLNDLPAASGAVGQLEKRYPRHPYVPFLRGRLAYAEGEYAAAEEALREYLARIPEDPRGHALMGAVSFSRNHLRQAEMYLQQAVRHRVGGNVTAGLLAETRLRLDKPDAALSALGGLDAAAAGDPALLALFGRAQLGLGNTPSALAYFERGAASDDRDEAVSLSLAAGFFSAGSYDRAVELLNSMPASADNNLRREALLIVAHIRDGNPAAARAVADTMLGERNDDAAAHSIVGVMHQLLGERDEARSALETAAALDTSLPFAPFALGRLAAMEDRSTAAVRHMEEALSRRPDFMPALAGLGALLVGEGDTERLVSHVDAALAADDSLFDAWLLKVRLAAAHGDLSGALAAVLEARERFPGEPRLDHAEALVQLQQGQRELALAGLRNAAAADSQNARFQLDLARASLDAGDARTAASAIAAYRELRPDDQTGLSAQVAILLREGEFARAEREVTTFVSRNGETQRTAILKGDVLLASGDADGAAQSFEVAGDLGFDRVVALRLAQSYSRAGRPDATAPLRRWLADNPDDHRSRRLLAQLLDGEGRHADAVSQYEQLVAAGAADAIALNNLAWRYAEEGRPEAVELARQAYELAPDNGSIVDTYGWILFRQGQHQRALELLERAAELSPDNPEIRFHLASVHAQLGNRSIAAAIMSDLLDEFANFPSRAEAEALNATL